MRERVVSVPLDQISVQQRAAVNPVMNSGRPYKSGFLDHSNNAMIFDEANDFNFIYLI